MRRDEPLDIVERGKGQPRLRSVHDVHDRAPPVRRRTLDMERQFGGHRCRSARIACCVAHRDVERGEALAAAVNRLIADPMLCIRMVRNAAERVEAEFSAAAVVAQWRELFADFGAE